MVSKNKNRWQINGKQHKDAQITSNAEYALL